MKNLRLFFAIISTFCLILFCGCPGKDYPPDSTLNVVNNSLDTLLSRIEYRYQNDTLLPIHSVFPSQAAINLNLILPKSKVGYKDDFILGLSSKEPNILTLWLFDLADVRQHPWDSIRINYMVKRRYDLTLDDLERLNWTITYP